QGVNLVLGGTTGNDVIVITPGGGGGAVHVVLNGTVLNFSGVGRVVVYAQAGNDNVIAASIDLPTELHGDDGNDHLQGGSAPNILIGGAGDDQLFAGPNRDLLIGGTGTDQLLAQGAEDILIAGFTTFDNDSVALAALLAEWTSARDYSTRDANLQG